MHRNPYSDTISAIIALTIMIAMLALAVHVTPQSPERKRYRECHSALSDVCSLMSNGLLQEIITNISRS